MCFILRKKHPIAFIALIIALILLMYYIVFNRFQNYTEYHRYLGYNLNKHQVNVYKRKDLSFLAFLVGKSRLLASLYFLITVHLLLEDVGLY